MTREEYSNIINQSSLRDHTIGGALRRAALDNPNQFGFKFKKIAPYRRIPWQFGWRGAVPEPLNFYEPGTVVVKGVPKMLPPGRVLSLPPGQSGIAGLLPPGKPPVPSVPPLSRVGSFKLPSTFRPYYAPNGNATLIQGNLFDAQPIGISFSKRGGKIIKAEGGTSLVDNNFGYDFSSDAFKNWFNNGGASILTGQKQSKFPELKPIEPIKGRAVASDVITTNTGQTYHGTQTIGDALRSSSTQYDPGRGGLTGRKLS